MKKDKSAGAARTTFRVHMQAEHIDITAGSVDEARKLAADRRPGLHIIKIKVLKEGATA